MACSQVFIFFKPYQPTIKKLLTRHSFERFEKNSARCSAIFSARLIYQRENSAHISGSTTVCFRYRNTLVGLPVG